MDYIVHGVAKSHTGLSDFHFTAPFVKLYPSSVLCIYVPHLYLFFFQRTLKLFPCLGYYKQRSNEYWSACVFLNYSFLGI